LALFIHTCRTEASLLLRSLLLYWPGADMIVSQLINRLLQQQSTCTAETEVSAATQYTVEHLYFIVVSFIESHNDSISGFSSELLRESPPRFAAASSLMESSDIVQSNSYDNEWVRAAVALLQQTTAIPNLSTRCPLIAARMLDLCNTMSEMSLFTGEFMS
jgi:hypothetical protein